MGVLMSLLKLTVAAIFPALLFLQPAVAGTNSIDSLMSQLRDALPTEAARLTAEIQLEWDKSGSASADFLLKRGRDAVDRGDLASAIDHFSALVDHAPDFAEGWVARAGAYFQADLLGPAVMDLEHALTLNPQHFGAIIGLATVFEVIGSPQDAYDAYLQVKAIHPTHPDVKNALQRLEPVVKGQQL